ncbi:hypothetical protein E4J66_06895 [Actinomyces viscosus]|nr:hypothetical protein [Actinomyces viscosus]TFH52655.1 hypothetical protein E4J66_06895 [Actinomyces viscosus]
MVLVAVLAIGLLIRTIAISFNPDIGPEGAEVRRVANAATKHLSNSPDVLSADIIEASADIGGTEARLNVRLKDDTSADAVADLLTSTQQAAFGKNSSDTNIYLLITLSWTLHGTSISTSFSATKPADAEFVRLVLATAGEANTIEGITGKRVDYGQVTTTPTTFTQPGVPNSSRTFTLNGWKVTSTSNKEGQFPNTVAFEQVIAAASQASTTGTIDLDTDSMSVTGLVTDDTKSLTPETAAPVVHAVADCTTAGLTTLHLNNWALNTTSSVADPWLSFTCNNGTWTPKHESSTGQDEAAILQKATEL